MADVPDRSSLHRPGYGRLAIAGFLLALQGLGAAASLSLFALGAAPGAQAIFGFAGPAIVIFLVELPLAILILVGGASLWLGRSLLVGVGATVAWIALSIVIGLAGGGFYALIVEAGLLVLILSGAWARRGPAGMSGELLLHGR